MSEPKKFKSSDSEAPSTEKAEGVQIGHRDMLSMPDLPIEDTESAAAPRKETAASPSKAVTIKPLSAPEVTPGTESEATKITVSVGKKAEPTAASEKTPEPADPPEKSTEPTAPKAIPASPAVAVKDPLQEAMKPALKPDPDEATETPEAAKPAPAVEASEKTAAPATAPKADETPTATDSIADNPNDKKDPGNQKTMDAEEAERAAHEQAVQKLIDSQKYALPIKTVEQRRSQHVIILGVVLMIILVAAWLDIALDAGLVHLHGVKAVTHFFST